jgi:antitoxin (DNA-binding transcriptional repressor) of toxin-antitoxin stability system
MVTKKIDIHTSPSLQELVSQLHEGVEILIVDGDKTLATLRPTEEPPSPRVPGLHEGSIWMSDDFDDPLPDEFWLGEDTV